MDPSPERFVDVFDGLSVATFRFANAGNAATLFSSEAGRRFNARLFDRAGVLIVEGTPVDEAALPRAVVPAGLVASALLQVPNLVAGEQTLLELVDLEFAPGGHGAATARISLTPVTR